MINAGFLSCDDLFGPDAMCVATHIMEDISRHFTGETISHFATLRNGGRLPPMECLDVLFFHPVRRYDIRRRKLMYKVWDACLEHNVCPVLVSDDLNVIDRNSKILQTWLGQGRAGHSEETTQIAAYFKKRSEWKGPILHTNFECIEEFWTSRCFEHIFDPCPSLRCITNPDGPTKPKNRLGYVGCWAPRRMKHLRRYKGLVTLVGPGWDKQAEHPFTFPFMSPLSDIANLYASSTWSLHLQDDWVVKSQARVSRIAESLYCRRPVLFDFTQVQALPHLPWESVRPWVVSNVKDCRRIMRDHIGRETQVAEHQYNSELYKAFYSTEPDIKGIFQAIKKWREQ